MSWIAVHDEVLGSKLRGFRKKVNCSEAEALGILTYFWLWVRKNTDITGLLKNTDIEDVENVVKLVITNSLDAKCVATALIECGWIDEICGQLYVHDWSEWQSYWYAYLSKKEKDKERKRRERAKTDSKDDNKKSPTIEPVDDSDEEASKTEEKKPKKIKYAESVSMLPEEHQKLVDTYGEVFTLKLIEELDNYKVANGKTYKNDYRAILNWVVEKCEKKYPELKKKESQPKSAQGSNPFADYM